MTRTSGFCALIAAATPEISPAMREEIRTNYPAGTTQGITLHDGSVIHLHKASSEYKTDDRQGALNAVATAKDEGRILTGLLYLDPNTQDLFQNLNVATRPLNELGDEELCPGSRVLNSINEGLR